MSYDSSLSGEIRFQPYCAAKPHEDEVKLEGWVRKTLRLLHASCFPTTCSLGAFLSFSKLKVLSKPWKGKSGDIVQIR